MALFFNYGTLFQQHPGDTMRYRPICKNREFSRVYTRGKSFVHPQVVLYVCKNRLGYTRVGLTATKKVGHAVVRNRARRVMRAALTEHLPENIGGYDVILVARGQTARLKSTQLEKTISKLLAKAGLPDKKPLVPHEPDTNQYSQEQPAARGNGDKA